MDTKIKMIKKLERQIAKELEIINLRIQEREDKLCGVCYDCEATYKLSNCVHKLCVRCVPSCNNICPFCRRHYELIRTYWEIKRDVEIIDRNDIEYPSLYDANIHSYSSLVDLLNMMANLLHGTVAQSNVIRICNKINALLGMYIYYRENVIDNMILEVKELKRQMNEHERPNNYSKTPNNWSVIPYTPQRRNQYSYHPLTPHGIVDKLLKIYSRDDIVYSAIPANQPIAPPPYNPGYIDPNTDLNTDLDSYHLQKASQQALRVKRMTEIHDEMDKLHKELRDLMQGLNMRERN